MCHPLAVWWGAKLLTWKMLLRSFPLHSMWDSKYSIQQPTHHCDINPPPPYTLPPGGDPSEYEFHLASYHTLVEGVTSLRIVTRHLVKVTTCLTCSWTEYEFPLSLPSPLLSLPSLTHTLLSKRTDFRENCTLENVGQFLEEINLGQHAAAFSGEISEEVSVWRPQTKRCRNWVNSPIERLEIRPLLLICILNVQI